MRYEKYDVGEQASSRNFQSLQILKYLAEKKYVSPPPVNATQYEMQIEEEDFGKLVNILNDNGLGEELRPEQHQAILEVFAVNRDPELSVDAFCQLYEIPELNISPERYSVGKMLTIVTDHGERVVALKALTTIIPNLKETVLTLGYLDECAELVAEYERIKNERIDFHNQYITAPSEGRDFAISSEIETYVKKWVNSDLANIQKLIEDIHDIIKDFEEESSGIVSEPNQIELSAVAPIVYSVLDGIKKKYLK